MDRRESASTASTGAPPVSSASPTHKRHHISSDETDPESIGNDAADRATSKPPQSPPPPSPPPSPPRPRKTANADEEDSEDEGRRNAWRTPISSDPFSLGPMRTFAIERDHPLMQCWAPLHDAIQAALEQQSPLHHWRAIEVFRRRRTIQPSPEGTDDTTVLVTISQGSDEGHRAALLASIKVICNEHGQSTLQVEVLEGSMTRG